MLCEVGFHARCKFVGKRVFRKHVADLVELLSGAFCFFQDQVILPVFRIFVKGIRTVISGAEHAGSRDGIIQRVEQVKTCEIPKFLFCLRSVLRIFLLRIGSNSFGSLFCGSFCGGLLFRFCELADQSEHVICPLNFIPKGRE